jgi:hypothetical protein
VLSTFTLAVLCLATFRPVRAVCSTCLWTTHFHSPSAQVGTKAQKAILGCLGRLVYQFKLLGHRTWRLNLVNRAGACSLLFAAFSSETVIARWHQEGPMLSKTATRPIYDPISATASAGFKFGSLPTTALCHNRK